MEPRFTFEVKLRAAFGLAMLVLVALAATAWYAAHEMRQATAWVAHSHEILDRLAQTKSDSLLIELNAQSYRLTNDTAHLAARDAAIAARELSLRRISELTADNPRQQAQWAQLRATVDERLAIARRSELLRRTEGAEAAQAHAATAPLRETRERLFQILREMNAEEHRLLQERAADQTEVRNFRTLLTAIITLLLAALLAATYVMIRRQLAERKQAEAALRTSEESLATTLHSIGDGVLATDTAGRITRMNPVAERLTGWPQGEAQGQPVAEVFHIINEQTRAPAEVPVAKVLASGALQGLANHTLLIARDGTEWPVADSAAPIRDADGQVIGVVLVFRDVTVERTAEQALRQLNESLGEASRAKSDFLANMSHELRTPLNAIIGFSEMLKDGVLGELDAKQRGFVDDIFTAGTHLLSLINDILDLSKVEAGMLELEADAVDVAELLQSSLMVIREKALAHRIRLDTRLDPALGTMLVDERKLKQIVYNLLSNAVKFTPAGGAVTLLARRCARSEVTFDETMPARLITLPPGNDAEFLAIEVEDSGVGIAEADLQKLYEPFTQVDSSVSRSHAGTGLGLSLVRRLAELHGGTVGVASRPREGSRFSVWLPYREFGGAGEAGKAATGPEDQPAAEGASPSRSAAPLALVVEDNDRMADLITAQLRSEGFAVIRAATAEEGLVRAAKRTPQLITLDIFLPNMDGWEFLRRLRADPRLADTPVVIITVSDDRDRGLALGARRVLHKPFAHDELVTVLAGLADVRPDGKPTRVLVVDDNVKAAELVATALEAEGYHVLRAYGGAEAIEVARSALPDLVILDLIMPEVSGFEVARALREAQATARIPILVLTAKEITAEDHARLNDGVSAILAKTNFDVGELLAELHRALPRHGKD